MPPCQLLFTPTSPSHAFHSGNLLSPVPLHNFKMQGRAENTRAHATWPMPAISAYNWPQRITEIFQENSPTKQKGQNTHVCKVGILVLQGYETAAGTSRTMKCSTIAWVLLGPMWPRALNLPLKGHCQGSQLPENMILMYTWLSKLFHFSSQPPLASINIKTAPLRNCSSFYATYKITGHPMVL